MRIPDPGRSPQHKTDDHPPGGRIKKVRIAHPPQPSSNNQRSDQICCDPDRLAKPGVQWIL
jgi:hypothetical protein